VARFITENVSLFYAQYDESFLAFLINIRWDKKNLKFVEKDGK